MSNASGDAIFNKLGAEIILAYEYRGTVLTDVSVGPWLWPVGTYSMWCGEVSICLS